MVTENGNVSLEMAAGDAERAQDLAEAHAHPLWERQVDLKKSMRVRGIARFRYS